MPVALFDGAAQTYSAQSSDPKPILNGIRPGATLFEEDTGNVWRYDGFQWFIVAYGANSSIAQMGNTLQGIIEAIRDLNMTVEMIRQGQIAMGNCDDINPADVSLTPAQASFS